MSQRDPVAVSIIGNDRVGIVATVTKVLFELGCNLEDVSSTILRGHFAMMLIVRCPDGIGPAEIEAALQPAASELELVASARPVAEADLAVKPPTHMISVYGADRPGIVFKVADALAGTHANITDLTSRVIGSDEQPVYAVMLEVAVPQDTDLDATLTRLKDELDVDIS
ncbi:MAG: glycine cleavage system protein R, partial [Actinomycetota bacterium]